MALKKYSVLLLYPHVTGDDPETYFAHVEAINPYYAQQKAKQEAALANTSGNYEVEDFYPLLVIEGHHKAI